MGGVQCELAVRCGFHCEGVGQDLARSTYKSARVWNPQADVMMLLIVPGEEVLASASRGIDAGSLTGTSAFGGALRSRVVVRDSGS